MADRQLAKPEWLRIKLETKEPFLGIKDILKRHKLHTVCEEAHCPNIPECWNGGTATFMVMGDTCTRSCGFCDIKTGRPAPLDWLEPERVARAVQAERRHAQALLGNIAGLVIGTARQLVLDLGQGPEVPSPFQLGYAGYRTTICGCNARIY